jgi:hypothetical protein
MLVDAQGTVIASSSPSEVGTSLFTRFDDTRDEFEQALHCSPGGVYISGLSEIPERLRRVVAAGKLADENLDIQMLTAVQDTAGHTVSGYLVYWDAHRRQRMAGYSRLGAYANQAGNWQPIRLKANFWPT